MVRVSWRPNQDRAADRDTHLEAVPIATHDSKIAQGEPNQRIHQAKRDAQDGGEKVERNRTGYGQT